MNAVLEQALASRDGACPPRLHDMVAAEESDRIDALVEQLAGAHCDSFRLQARGTGRALCSEWIAWRVSEPGGDLLLLIEEAPEEQCTGDELLQHHRWEALGRLAGGVCHDFNNLLTGVTLYCDLLLAGLESSHRLRRYAEEIRSAAFQADGLVRQLLVSARQRGVESHLVSLNQLVTGMQNLLARLIGENIALKFHLTPHPGLVKIDPAQVQQVLLNLVLNARDALPDGGEITVETRNCAIEGVAESSSGSGEDRAFPCVLLAVGDNGRGMDMSTRQRLFEPFFTTKGPQKGNGLGLATVHDIVSRAGGLIHVESAPGRGTRMMILLPRASESGADVPQSRDQGPGVLPQTQNQPSAEELIL